ncbi:hypothetical protein [Nocardiopsis dassonvillei]|uniref:hypothetical protein n=1 Tax=Nocardiopsis dassonvillei TaxID=2014 RepID=UPI00157D4F75|nr:hypothetical protein [Nocardiopsis dassonvillei]
MTPNASDYLHLDPSINQLSPAERFALLGALSQLAGPWLRGQRARLVDELREELGGDTEVAEHLGVSRTALANLGDGPVGPGGIRPRLLKQVADLISMYGQDAAAASPQMRQVHQVLAKRGVRSEAELRGVATRLMVAGRNIDIASMSVEERDLWRRGIAHAASTQVGS